VSMFSANVQNMFRGYWFATVAMVIGYLPIAGLIMQAAAKLTGGFPSGDTLLSIFLLTPPLCALCATLLLVIGSGKGSSGRWQVGWWLCLVGGVLGWPISLLIAVLSTGGGLWSIRG